VPEYAAFLRGINVGGNHLIGSPELRAIFEGLGLTGVATFRASGNVVFAAPEEASAGGGRPTDGGDLAAMTERIERGLAAALGYEVATFLRTAGEIRAIAAHEPFAPEVVAASGGKPQVILLRTPPPPEAREEVLGLAGEGDRLAFGERELHWLPSGGMSDSALELKRIERLLGPTTIRTAGTVGLIAAKHFAD
jgi:uncharacterized protein (DUF1697 family)